MRVRLRVHVGVRRCMARRPCILTWWISLTSKKSTCLRCSQVNTEHPFTVLGFANFMHICFLMIYLFIYFLFGELLITWLTVGRSVQWRHQGGPPRVTPSNGWHPNLIIFLWLNLQRTLNMDKWRWMEGGEGVGVVTRRQLKNRSFSLYFQKTMTKKGRHVFHESWRVGLVNLAVLACVLMTTTTKQSVNFLRKRSAPQRKSWLRLYNPVLVLSDVLLYRVVVVSCPACAVRFTGVMAGSPCPVELVKKVIDLMQMSKFTVSVQAVMSFS